MNYPTGSQPPPCSTLGSSLCCRICALPWTGFQRGSQLLPLHLHQLQLPQIHTPLSQSFLPKIPRTFIPSTQPCQVHPAPSGTAPWDTREAPVAAPHSQMDTAGCRVTKSSPGINPGTSAELCTAAPLLKLLFLLQRSVPAQ